MSTTRPAMPHIEHIAINYTEVLGTNRLQYNTAVGVFETNGATKNLEAFLASIRLRKPHRLNTFFGGTLGVQQVDAPLFCHRTAESVGPFWTLTPPTSPWQHALEMSMPPYIYPENMKLEPNYHPANKGVLIYQIPAGKIVANGKCAPLGGFPGMGNQLYIPHVPEEQVRMASWSQWKANHHLPHAYNIEWREGRIVSLWSSIENAKAQAVINKLAAPVFNSFTAELSDLAVRNGGSSTFKVVTEYGAVPAVAMKNISFAGAPQPIKIWDISHSTPTSPSAYKFPQNQQGIFEIVPPTVAPMHWRSPISEGKSVSWYRSVNYPMLGGLALKIATPPLMAWDAYHRMQNDKTQFPGYSNQAHGAAVATDMVVDYGMYAGLASITSAGAAIPLAVFAEMGCEIGNALRDIPAEAMMNNRDFLLATIDGHEFSPEVQQMLLDDFDNGGTKSRNFNRTAAEITKTIFKPLEWAHDLKKGASSIARDIVDLLTHGHQSESLPPANVDKAESAPFQETEGVIISAEIDKHFDEPANPEPSELPWAPQISSSFNQQSTTNSGQVKLVERSEDKLLLNISMGTSIMTPDFHGFLFDINRSPVSSEEVSVKVNMESEADIPEEIKIDREYKTSPGGNDYPKQSDEKPVIPFISNVRLGKVGDKLGVISTIAGAAQVGVTASQDGFLVSVTAEFGAEFWSAMGAGLGVGAVIASALLLAKHFYSLQQKHISHKITSGIKRANNEGLCITDALNKLHQNPKEGEAEASLQSLIDQTKSLRIYISSRIEREKSRAHYAKKHNSKDGKKAHYERIDTYEDISDSLFHWHESLKQEQTRLNFIGEHAKMKGDDLVVLAKDLITKFATPADAADISAKESIQPDVIEKVDSYINSGYKLYKYFNGKSHGRHLTSSDAKQYLLNGGKVKAKSKQQNGRFVLSMLASTYSDAHLEKISGMKCLIDDELIGLTKSGQIDEAKKLIAETSFLDEFRTEAEKLQLMELSSFLNKFSEHAKTVNELFGDISDKGKRGFNREAADTVERLRKMDGDLDLKNIEDDFRFLHQEQQIGLFTGPAQDILLKFTLGYKPSPTRTVALGAINLVNTVQIITPNALSLSLQALHAKCMGNDMCIVNRSFNALLTQVSMDINPFSSEFNPFNTRNYFNGAMIYGQLLLKGAECFPLNWVVPDKKLSNIEAWRSSILSYGNQGFRGIHTATSMMQIMSNWKSANGLFQFANTPLLLASVTKTAVDASYWAYHKYKASRGESPENPSHYYAQEGAGYGLDTLGAIAFAGLITGGMGWFALFAGLVSSGKGIYSYNCEATTKDNAVKSMLASCSNISYLRALESAIQYVNSANFRLIQHVPTDADLFKVKSRSEILFRKHGNLYYIYFSGDEPGSYLNKQLKNHNDFLRKLAWPDASQAHLVESRDDLTSVANLAKDAMASEAIMKEYTSVVPYRLLRREPWPYELNMVAKGKIIIIYEKNINKNISYNLYLKNQDGKIDTVLLAERLSIFDLLENNSSFQVDSASSAYREVAEFATGCVIKQRLKFGNDNIKLRLSVFGGLGYVADSPDQERANFARIFHLHQIVKDYYDQQNHDAVLKLTKKFSPNNKILINADYKLPPHLAWQLIVNYRLATLVQSINHLHKFRDQYRKYSKYIYDSASESKPWYSTNWESVRESLTHVLSLAMHQFVSAAYNSPNPKDKLNYLSYITQAYEYCKDWYDVLEDDELKCVAGSIYFSLGDKQNCKLFFSRINNLSALLKIKNDGNFTANTLAILDDINSDQYSDILSTINRDDLALNDERLLLHSLELINKNEFSKAKSFLDNLPDFHEKYVGWANYIFLASGKSDLMGALSILLTEKHKLEEKSLYYWMTLERIIERCLESAKYSPRQATKAHTHAKLWGWRVICLNYIQTFNLNLEDKNKTSELIDTAKDYIQQCISRQKKRPLTSPDISKICDELIEQGHQAIRGENEMSLLSELEVILQDVSFDYNEDGVINKYMPLDVPSDGDCAFHLFGVSRKAGIDLLLQHVRSQAWVSNDDQHRNDIIAILLDDLEFKNNKCYNRSEENFKENVQLVVTYLQSLLSPGVWLAHNQGSRSVIDALAFLLSKNLRIFMADDTGILSLSSSNIHSDQFEMVDVLYTSAQGFATRLSDLNHFIRLRKLPLKTLELEAQGDLRSHHSSASSHLSRQGLFRRGVPKPLEQDKEVLDKLRFSGQ